MKRLNQKKNGIIYTISGKRCPQKGVISPFMFVAFVVCQVVICGCIVKEECSSDTECGSGKICVATECREGCRLDRDCSDSQECVGTYCINASNSGNGDAGGDGGNDQACATVNCPEDMVAICGYCMDIYEASRKDASETNSGRDDSVAQSRQGVLPWLNMTHDEARAACVAAGKRLCTRKEWVKACRGPNDTEYPYGDAYQTETCNGIDTFGRGNQHLMPIGSFPDCTNGYGIFDISGNAWEIDEDMPNLVHGGAYNCIDSRRLHQCSYNATSPSAPATNVGFRCCSDGV